MIIKSKNQPTLIIRDQNYNFEFSSEVSKQNKKYYSEIICITNCTDESHLHEWLYWHINIIKIEHLVLIDNTPDGKLETIAKKFNVSYKNITGILSQCDIYNDYVNNSEAEWVLPIDDDEYLYVSKKYDNNINVFLNSISKIHSSYKYSLNWHMMFSKDIMSDYSKSYINEYHYTTTIKSIDSLDCYNLIKTFVNTKLKHLYVNDNKTHQIIPDYKVYNNVKISDKHSAVLGTVHHPLTKIGNEFVTAYNLENNCDHLGFFYDNLDINADCCIYHYKYRSIDDWKYKINNYKFVDINKDHIAVNYQLNTITRVYNYVKDKLIFDTRLFELFKKLIYDN